MPFFGKGCRSCFIGSGTIMEFGKCTCYRVRRTRRASFFGQSFDSHHPELILYDFANQSDCMVPRLRIVNENNECKVKPVVDGADDNVNDS